MARNDVIQTLVEFGVWPICIGKKLDKPANMMSRIYVAVCKIESSFFNYGNALIQVNNECATERQL